jgi:EAL domain-containing protein (putative c-di-GMP-specific phosphodiesterase class I)
MNQSNIDFNKGPLHVYFQPVINADKYEVVGYEVFGELAESGNLSDEQAWEKDKQIYITAVKKALKMDNKPRLFFNIRAAVLGPLDAIEELLDLFTELEAEGWSRENTVFEINAGEYEGTLQELTHILLYLKACGYDVSLDEVRVTDTHLDKFSALEPTLIKVDVSDLQETSAYYTYSEILDTLAFFARKLGTTLHFTGIENSHQLHMAWRNGGRYFQGPLFGDPAFEGVHVYALKSKTEEHIHSYIDMHQRSLKRQTELLSTMDREVKAAWSKHTSVKTLMKALVNTFHEESFRMYMCNHYGYQQSVNWTKDEFGIWKEDPGAEGKNWSWRVYFLDHVMEMQFNKNGMLSDKYRDIETNEIIRTYSFPLTKDLYLFIDLDPIYLYKKNWFS